MSSKKQTTTNTRSQNPLVYLLMINKNLKGSESAISKLLAEIDKYYEFMKILDEEHLKRTIRRLDHLRLVGELPPGLEDLIKLFAWRENIIIPGHSPTSELYYPFYLEITKSSDSLTTMLQPYYIAKDQRAHNIVSYPKYLLVFVNIKGYQPIDYLSGYKRIASIYGNKTSFYIIYSEDGKSTSGIKTNDMEIMAIMYEMRDDHHAYVNTMIKSLDALLTNLPDEFRIVYKRCLVGKMLTMIASNYPRYKNGFFILKPKEFLEIEWGLNSSDVLAKMENTFRDTFISFLSFGQIFNHFNDKTYANYIGNIGLLYEISINRTIVEGFSEIEGKEYVYDVPNYPKLPNVVPKTVARHTLPDWLDSRYFEWVHANGRGNTCFFNTLSLLLYGNESKQKEFRDIIYQEYVTNKEKWDLKNEFQLKYTTEGGAKPYIDPIEYDLDEFLKSGSMMTDITVGIAAAALKRTIFVITYESSNGIQVIKMVMKIPPGENGENDLYFPLYILNQVDYHYDPLFTKYYQRFEVSIAATYY